VADRAALFDATGTLIALREPVGDTYARIAAEHGIGVSAWRLGDAFRRVIARSDPTVLPAGSPETTAAREREAWREIVRQTFLAADTATAQRDLGGVSDALFAHFGRAAAWRVREGAEEALCGLREAGVATAVVSNFDGRLRGILDGLGLGRHLDLVWLPADAGAAKPDPAIFTGALRALGVAPSRALFVGDDAARDLAGARAAGIAAAVDAGSLATLADLPSRFAREIPEVPPR
jgi:putative hydrolase of the HAD superfamily